MSNVIFYDKQFIELKSKPGYFIPMILMGDSNMYESYNSNKRVRKWTFMAQGAGQCDRMHYTSEELIENCKGLLDGNDEDFGWESGLKFYGRGYPSYRQYENFVKNGIKDALPLDELIELGVGGLEGTVYKEVHDNPDNPRLKPVFISIPDEETYFNVIEKYGMKLRLSFTFKVEDLGKRGRKLIKRKKATS